MNAISKPLTIIEQMIENDPRLRSYHTKRQYKAHLSAFEGWRGGREMTKTLVESYLAHLLRQGQKPGTVNQKLAALRWWAAKIIDLTFDYSPDLAEQLSKQAARILTIKIIPMHAALAGRHVKPDEMTALLNACMQDESKAGTRDAAFIAVAIATGMRQAEIRNIKMDDLTPIQVKDKNGQIIAEYEIGVIGKGDKAGKAYLSGTALDLLQKWLAVRGVLPGFVFVRLYKGDSLPKRFAKGLSHEGARRIIETRIDGAGLGQALTWHDFRRTLAGNLYSAGVDGSTIQGILRHASQNQTQKYDRRPEDRKREAVRTLDFPQVPHVDGAQVRI